jgi:hypothetical protein
MLIVLGAALVLSSAGLSSLSDSLQQSQSSLPWRESTVSASGWALIASGIYLSTLNAGTRGRATRVTASLVLAVSLALTANFNLERRPAELSSPRNVAEDRVSLEVAVFAATSQANQLRCRAKQFHFQAYADLPEQHERIMSAVDGYVLRHHGVPFCDDTKDFGQ